jgi:hypothetical protein
MLCTESNRIIRFRLPIPEGCCGIGLKIAIGIRIGLKLKLALATAV